VRLATVHLEDGVTDDLLDTGTWELDIVGTRYPANVSRTPVYYPKRGRIMA
jgi:hypothetical protein